MKKGLMPFLHFKGGINKMIKVKKALVLAGGMGTRLRPLSLTTPKPLLEIKGVPIVESIIRTLIIKGIEEIYLVIGYGKEKFNYLKEKYQEVEFIYNKDYATRDTMSALYAARNVLNDHFIIIDGDLYVGNRNVINTKIDKSHYLYRPLELQNDEWGFHLDFLTNNVLEVRKPNELVYLNNKLYGVSFWLKDDLAVLLAEIKDKYNDPAYVDKTYDEVINNILDKITLGVVEIPDKQLFEIKVLEELLEVDDSYVMFKSIDLLCKVLKIEKDDITKIYDSPGRSLNNQNYVVEVGNKKYLLRIPGKGTELFNDRKAEREAYLQLKDQDLAEEAYFIDPISGIKISRFYDESRILDVNNEDELKALMKKLKKLHEGSFKFNHDDVFDRMRRYDSYVASVRGRKYYTNEFKEIHREILKIEETFKDNFEQAPIHADLSPNNVLITKEGKVVLIDLEFVSMGDPYTDLANFSHDANYSSLETIKLLELYLDRKPKDNEIYKLLLLCSAVSVMWYIWAVYKMSVEEQSFEMYEEYRDLYLEYAIRMRDAANEYKI